MFAISAQALLGSLEDPWEYLSTPLRNSDLVKYLFLLSTALTKVPWVTMKQGFQGSFLKAKSSELYRSLINKNTLVLGGTEAWGWPFPAHLYSSPIQQVPPSLKQWGRQCDSSPYVGE